MNCKCRCSTLLHFNINSIQKHSTLAILFNLMRNPHYGHHTHCGCQPEQIKLTYTKGLNRSQSYFQQIILQAHICIYIGKYLQKYVVLIMLCY